MEAQLSNGIKVIFHHLEGFAGTFYWWNQVGSRNELKGEEGFAHFLEHMLFKDAGAKDTGKASTGQIARSIESLGGEINAYTSFEQTVYHVTCGEKYLEEVVNQFGSMAKPERFLKDDFVREREVIFEEIRRYEDSPGRQQMARLFEMTYPRHAYGRPVLGFKKTLQKATTAKLEKFYKENYRPENMGLILVGPFGDVKRQQKLLQILESRFGEKVIPRGKARKQIAPSSRSTAKRQAKIVSLKQSVASPSMIFSFGTPALTHPDVPALDFLSGILGSGESSRLYQNLFYDQSLVTDASAGLYVPNDRGMFYASADVEDESKIAPAAEALFEEIRRLKLDGPTKEETDRVLVNAQSERVYATQSVDSMAGRIGFLRFVLGDTDFDDRFLERLKSLTSQEMTQTAKEYFQSQYLSGVVSLPKEIKKFDTAPILKKAKSILDREKVPSSSAAKKTPSAPSLNISLIERPSGLKIVHVDRPHSKIVGIQACLEGGLRYEDKRWGAGYLMSSAWTKGTKHRNSRQISSLVEGHAASLDGFAGRNSVGLEMTCLAANWENLSALFSEVLLEPVFPAEEVVHARRIILDSLRSQQDSSGALVQKLFLESLFESHPYGRVIAGSEETIDSMNSLILSDFHHEWVQLDRMVISISGPVTGEQIEHFAHELEARAEERKKLAPHLKLNAEPHLSAPRWAEKKLNREQVHTIVGGLGLTVDDKDRFALRILQTILGGQSGRLFIELREKKSLAYTVGPMSFEGLEPGYAGTYIASAPNKKEEAIKGIQKVMEQVVKKGPSKKEMDRAVAFYLGRRAMGLQSDSAIAAAFGLRTLFGQDPRNYDEVDKILKKISPNDVKKVCEKYLLKPHMVTASVG